MPKLFLTEVPYNTIDNTDDYFHTKFYASNIIKLCKRNIIIDLSIIERYKFLNQFLNHEGLLFEDIYFTILYIKNYEEDDENKSVVTIYNFIIDKLHKSYCKNSMNYEELKDSILNLYFYNMKKSFIYSNLHLSGYEYDMNHDINEWLNNVKYIDTIYQYPYISKVIEIDKDYLF